MSLNWREIALILSELPLEGSVLQAVVQHDFNALSWHFYHREVGRWTLYTEVGTPHSRLHLLSTPITEKTAKLQRFIQFARARLIGSRVTQVHQAPYDRLVRLSLDNHGTALFLFIRLYSGSGANIIVTDEHLIIQDLLLRRPRRGEVSGALFDPGPERTEEGKPFTIRARTEGSFNRQIEAEYSRESSAADLDELLRVVRTRGEREIEGLRASIASQKKSLEASADHEQLRKEADLLSANAHLLSDNADEIELFDWKTNAMLTIALDSRLKGRAQIQRAYERYQKAKGASEHALGELARLEEELAVRIKQLEELLCPHNDHAAWIADLKRASEGTAKAPPPGPKSPGLVIRSGAFTLLVGRNAKENDELLRRHTRGNDWWMHTRDYSGGYVFIKDIRGKSVPLEVLLDAATLAIHYSKARKEGKAELYYTQVKYLRRAKGGPQGLVLPTQEKNLSVVLDEGRLRQLLLPYDDL